MLYYKSLIVLLSATIMVAFFSVNVPAHPMPNNNKNPALNENAFVPPSSPDPPGPSPPNNGIPPGFEDVLPKDILQKLRDLYNNQGLSFSEKREKFDEIMNVVSGETLAKLPPPPGFESLPENMKQKINQIHTNASLSWNEKHKLISDIIDSLPIEERSHIGSLNQKSGDFFPPPPPGFEKVLPKEVYKKLLKIHADSQLEPKQKMIKIDQIMRSQPKEILDKLPLPPGFDKLRPDLLQKARTLFSDTTLDYESKNKAIVKFVKSLPKDQQALVRYSLPPTLEQLPQDVKNKIDSVFLNEELDEEQRDGEFRKIIDGLPEEWRRKVYNELNSFHEPSRSKPNSQP